MTMCLGLTATVPAIEAITDRGTVAPGGFREAVSLALVDNTCGRTIPC
jgi:hydrogenase maturation factor